ncbi:MAG: peptidoglycan DD-metalloendopeptidase family protein [Pseudomonadota bacterium]
MSRAIFLAALMALAPPQLSADVTAEARQAIAQLETATIALEAAGSGRDRVAALTETISAFETGLAAMRSGLRTVSAQEAALAGRLGATEDEVAGLLGVLQHLGRRDTPQILLHPEGPTGAARAAMVLAEVTPALQGEIDVLRRDLEDVSTLRILQQDAAEKLRAGLTGLQDARAALALAIADRGPLPKRFTADPVQLAVLIGASETLTGFADGLGSLTGDVAPVEVRAADLQGTLPLPVFGTVLRRFQEPDAAGIERPGLILATRPSALVTAPTDATVRFTGDLLDYGNVIILEPARGLLLVLAGLQAVYVDTGDVVQTRAPLGLMGAAQDSASTGRSEALYIEVRYEGSNVNPEGWFAMERK